ncbi:hypothetical protein TI39_contig572g00009 [Zymoseptoria brevis]|uniref:Uncharacterized protein n=1 Tax=Zymoseptoria brevis TaxID=1047168 RepID=A0A0F4GI37_9PEZI|nr:hypothetical protein TI39_contig572g00009 [Zymoseptoria brevis]
MASKDTLYPGLSRKRNLNAGKEISSSTTLSFTSQLSSLIGSSTTKDNSKSTPARSRPRKKDDIFTTHNRNTAKRAKRDLEADVLGTFAQKHTTNGEALGKDVWERSKRKMEEKARLYAAMKRGDVEDADERYAVDFDTKWAEARAEGREDSSSDNGSEDGDAPQEEVEYTDEFGRTRKGTKLDALRARTAIDRAKNAPPADDRFTARPVAPTSVIYGDTIQHQAFDPDEPLAAQMADLAKKRDRSLTPPPEEHFDGRKEVRTKGTGFFQFDADESVRKEQMAGLERERAETEKMRKARESKLDERRALIEKRREEVRERNSRRKAEEFLEGMGMEMQAGTDEVRHGQVEDDKIVEQDDGVQGAAWTVMTERIEAAIRREGDE